MTNEELWEAWEGSVSGTERINRHIAVTRIIQAWETHSTTLDLSGLELTSLPPELPSSITELNLENNQLHEWPEHLPPNLQRLRLGFNNLSVIPNDINLPLRELSLEYNNLNTTPSHWPNTLVRLTVFNNQLISIDNLPQGLRYLSVNNNQLSRLPTLPQSLEYLSASTNQITNLPSTWPHSLVDLNLSYNPLTPGFSLPPALINFAATSTGLTEFPSSLPATLQTLIVLGNRISHWPDILPPNLTNITLSDNLLTDLPIDLLRSIPSLRSVMIERNPLAPETTQMINNLVSGDTYHGPRIYFGSPASQPSSVRWFRQDGSQIAVNITNMAPTRQAEVPRPPATLPTLIESLGLIPRPIRQPMSIPWHLLGAEGSSVSLSSVADDALSASQERPLHVSDYPFISQTLFDAQSYPQRLLDAEQPLQLTVSNWFNSAEANSVSRTWAEFINEPAANDFNNFIFQLRKTASADIPGFQQQVSSWLVQLAADPVLREQTFNRALQATATCEDQVAYVYNEMQRMALSARVANSDLNHLTSEMIDTARQVFRMERLDLIAREQFSRIFRESLNPEEIEVSLAYLVSLRERLHLTSVTSAMNYPNFLQVMVPANAQAEAFERIVADENRDFVGWLAEWEPWQQALSRIAPDQYQAALERRADAFGAS
ncbi:NEL-type E3 ubiquitin ligase domain-containing protein, partial [Enterobacter sp. A103]|uniref:NEL-type E3 ubiquitin ligase domain-containing protein n=1 Tax=Enterobacter sp. A103 TaxID=3102785 RepID=UPI002ACA8BF9